MASVEVFKWDDEAVTPFDELGYPLYIHMGGEFLEGSEAFAMQGNVNGENLVIFNLTLSRRLKAQGSFLVTG